MNEEQIVASLASKVPREPLLQKPDEPSKIVQEVVKEAEPTVAKYSKYPNDLAAMKLLDFFEVDRSDYKDRTVLDKLSMIYTWASEQSKSEDTVDVLTQIRDLESRLGLAFRTKDKLDSVYRWIKLDKERRRVEKEMALV